MPPIHPEGRIIDPKYQWMHEKQLQEHVEDATVWVGGKKLHLLAENQELILRFMREARMGKTLKKRAKTKIKLPRLIKYLQDLKKLDQYYRRPLGDLEDVEDFIMDLEDGSYTTRYGRKGDQGKAYAQESVVGIKMVVIKFITWLHPPDKAQEMVGWIDTSVEPKDYDFITLEQARELVKVMASNTNEQIIRNRALLMFLFDSGCRADELLNIRLKHVQKEGGDYKVWIKFSKTKQRNLVLPLATEHLEAWMKIHPAKDEPLAQLFPMTEKESWDMNKNLQLGYL